MEDLFNFNAAVTITDRATGEVLAELSKEESLEIQAALDAGAGSLAGTPIDKLGDAIADATAGERQVLVEGGSAEVCAAVYRQAQMGMKLVAMLGVMTKEQLADAFHFVVPSEGLPQIDARQLEASLHSAINEAEAIEQMLKNATIH